MMILPILQYIYRNPTNKARKKLTCLTATTIFTAIPVPNKVRSPTKLR